MTTQIKYVKQVLCACLILIGLQSYGQVPEFNWNAHSSNASIGAVDVELNSNLSRSATVLTWHQSTDNASDTQYLTVRSIEGEWDEQTMIGSVTYKIELDDQKGEFQIIGDGQNITMNLELDSEDGRTNTYVFYIDSFNIN